MSLFCQDSIRLATALVLLIAIGISAWVELQFPAWILAGEHRDPRGPPTSRRDRHTNTPAAEGVACQRMRSS